MPFEVGNHLGRKTRVIDTMIRACLAQDESDAARRKERSRLRRAIEAQLDRAAEGDLASLDWITCRVDGKAVQAVDVSSNDGDIKTLTIQQLSAMLAQATGRQALPVIDAETVGEAPVGAIEAGVGTTGVGGGENPSAFLKENNNSAFLGENNNSAFIQSEAPSESPSEEEASAVISDGLGVKEGVGVSGSG